MPINTAVEATITHDITALTATLIVDNVVYSTVPVQSPSTTIIIHPGFPTAGTVHNFQAYVSNADGDSILSAVVVLPIGAPPSQPALSIRFI